MRQWGMALALAGALGAAAPGRADLDAGSRQYRDAIKCSALAQMMQIMAQELGTRPIEWRNERIKLYNSDFYYGISMRWFEVAKRFGEFDETTVKEHFSQALGDLDNELGRSNAQEGVLYSFYLRMRVCGDAPR